MSAPLRVSSVVPILGATRQPSAPWRFPSTAHKAGPAPPPRLATGPCSRLTRPFMTSAPSCQPSAAPASEEIESLSVKTEQVLALNDPSDTVQSVEQDCPASPAEPTFEYQPTHTIPPDVLARLKAARADGDIGPCWTYELYRDADDKPPSCHYCRTLADSEKYAKLFLGESHLGLDLEWKPSSPLWGPAKDNVSTIQLASQTRVAVFHVALHTGDKADELIAPTLRQILEDPNVFKAGVQVGGDANRLRRHLSVDVASTYELSPLYRTVTFATTNRSEYNRRLFALSRQVEDILGLPLYKGDDVRSSDWTKPLNKAQVVYAASDAYAGWWLYTALHARWHAMDPRPPLPKPASQRTATPTPSPAATASTPPDDSEPTARPRRRKPPVKLPPSPALSAAEAWLAAHAPSHPAPAARALRAYALWHVQGLSVRAAASTLRRPALSPATVAGYVADALVASWRRGPGLGLPLEAERAGEVGELLGPAPRRAWEWACREAAGGRAGAAGAHAAADPDARYFSESDAAESAEDVDVDEGEGSEFEPGPDVSEEDDLSEEEEGDDGETDTRRGEQGRGVDDSNGGDTKPASP